MALIGMVGPDRYTIVRVASAGADETFMALLEAHYASIQDPGSGSDILGEERMLSAPQSPG